MPQDRWQKSALAFSTAAFTIFIINLPFVLWATLSVPIQDGIGIISEQSCASIKAWNTAIHIIINIISTILLAGSNYCMQCLIAPTRSEIDKAHARHKWLDVGIPSARNLSCVTTKRRLLWFLLSLSSFPLHLMY
ncbi:hypothetical protein CKAH01_13962 [Colletotrichum kahawae]|uniref:DUF6536 domain-containing protein n=1 Tax=Colletotrichum kahawae TaxID=34407 RepID=A0AAD9YP87_COLKA|nr:hypothetical protein CKAH01_13962 [Colletotrichum kahawae]